MVELEYIMWLTTKQKMLKNRGNPHHIVVLSVCLIVVVEDEVQLADVSRDFDLKNFART